MKAHPRPTKAGAGRAVPHTVNVERLAKTLEHRTAAPAGRTFAPRFSLTTPNGATITSEFDGTTAASSGQTGGLPTRPDASSATNGSQIVEVSNNFIQFFDNNGATMCGTGTGLPLTTFLHTSDQLGAPELQFDNFQGHFIASVPVESFVSTSIPALYVLISNTSNPCGDWHFYRMTFGGGPYAPGNRLDGVIMGQDRNAVLFEANIFSSGQQFQGYSIFPIDKADLYANNGVSFPAFTVGSQAAPVVNAGEPMISSSSAFFLGADPQIGYQLYRMSGSGTASPSVTLQATIGAPYSGPQQAVTPSPSVGLNAGDGRITSPPVFDGTRIWFAHGISQIFHPTSVRFGYVDVTTNTQSNALMTVDPLFSYEFNGSVGVGLNADGTDAVFLNWAYTDPNKNVNVSDAVDSFVFNGSVPTTVGNLQTLLTGTAPNDTNFGIHSSVAVEPSHFGNTSCAITTQEYFDGTWNTRLARVCSPNQINVPFVELDTPAQAGSVLFGFGLAAGVLSTTTNCGSVPVGEVVSTTPAFDTPVPFGTGIGLTVCVAATTTVPDVIGRTVATATSIIQAAGLVVGSIGGTTSCDVGRGTIVSTSPSAGDTVSAGSKVNMVKSTGPPKNPCP